MMLSSLTPIEIEKAILNGNVALIQSIKGIGPKTAQRAILELKDKISGTSSTSSSTGMIQQKMGVQDEALQALIALGIARPMAEKALGKIVGTNQDASVEQMIKLTLKSL
jgi:Holliday junction DNA helicase RuvA